MSEISGPWPASDGHDVLVAIPFDEELELVERRPLIGGGSRRPISGCRRWAPRMMNGGRGFGVCGCWRGRGGAGCDRSAG